MLDYDNSAFYYFAMTLMCMYLIPGTWSVLSEVYKAFFTSGDVDSSPRCDAEKAKFAKIKAETTGLARLTKRAFLINLLCLIVTWAIFAYFMYMVLSTEGNVQVYDPYAILGVEQGATSNEIKKAYRKLSLRYHPDKNIGNKEAEDMFKKIAKAHEALTDEKSKENYEKYGNPDGRQQSLEVSIGLPTILLENPKVVLVLYLVGMVVVIPTAVGLWYSQSKEYGEKNIFYDTYRTWLRHIKSTDQKMKQLPEILAASAECRKINMTNSKIPPSEEELHSLQEKFQAIVTRPVINDAATLKGNILLHTHLTRTTKDLTPALQSNLDAMLVKAPELIDGMIELAYQQRFLETTITLLKFSQNIVQGLWVKSSPFAQLVQLNDEEIKTLAGSFPAKATAFGDFLALPDADKVKLLHAIDRLKAPANKGIVDEVLRTASLLPNLHVHVDQYVEEEENNLCDLLDDDSKPEAAAAVPTDSRPSGKAIHENDLVTLKLTMTRKNVKPLIKGGKVVQDKGTAHKVLAPYFMRSMTETWWLILIGDIKGEAQIHAIEKVTDQSEIVEHKLRFMCAYSASSTPYDMKLMIISDCYSGLDQEHAITFTVYPQVDIEYKSHEEDLALDNEPTLFEQVMTQTMDYDSSDDEDDDEPSEKPHTGGNTSSYNNGDDESDEDD